MAFFTSTPPTYPPPNAMKWQGFEISEHSYDDFTESHNMKDSPYTTACTLHCGAQCYAAGKRYHAEQALNTARHQITHSSPAVCTIPPSPPASEATTPGAAMAAAVVVTTTTTTTQPVAGNDISARARQAHAEDAFNVEHWPFTCIHPAAWPCVQLEL